MSFRGNTNEPFIIETQDTLFTTSPINFYPSQSRGLVIVRMTIDNQDPTNELTFNKNERGGRVYIVPPNSLAVITNEIMSGIRVIPNATTGTGIISADLSSVASLKREGFIGSA